jgi:cobalt-zinc-cadmium efflux system membrane fusion protein
VAPKALPPAGEVWLTPDQARTTSIEVSTAAERDFDDEIVTSGRVAFDDMRVGHVFSPVTGRVQRITAQLGERVKRGAALAIIESPEIGSAMSDLGKARADFIAAEHDYERQKALNEGHAASEAALEQAEDSWRRARAELERARRRAALLHAGDAHTVSQTYSLVSPIDGAVVARNINPGFEVQGQYGGGAATELFTIGEIDEVWVLGDVYEGDLAKVRVGSPVTVTAVALPARVLSGTIDWVSSILDADTRTAKVRCRLSNPDKTLRPEMFATLRISVDRRRALAVPRSAVLQLGGYGVVFLQTDEGNTRQRFLRVPVDVELDAPGDWIEVRHGIQAGQRVVARGADSLSQML